MPLLPARSDVDSTCVRPQRLSCLRCLMPPARAGAGPTARGPGRVHARAAHAAPCKAGRRTRRRACSSGAHGPGSLQGVC